jgi:hypothetical protein
MRARSAAGGILLDLGTWRDAELVRAEPFDAIDLELAALWLGVVLRPRSKRAGVPMLGPENRRVASPRRRRNRSSFLLPST